MRNATRKVMISLTAIAILSAPATATADDDIPLSRTIFEANNIRYEAPLPRLQVQDATARQQEQVDRAVEMFATAGLELPPLIVRFSEDSEVCEGNLGTFRTQSDGEPAIVSICTNMRITLIHELAHAWDHHMLSDERRHAFMAHWGLDNWNDRSQDWHDRASERAADTIAYTLLLDEPTKNPDILQYVCGYGILTGQELPETAVSSCGGTDELPR